MMMKSTILNTFLTLALAMSIGANAQENSLNLLRAIPLTPETENQTVDIDVAGDVVTLKLKVMCDIEAGQVTIEVFDPSGNKQGKFTVGSEGYVAVNAEGRTNRGREYGKLEKNIKEPENGTWKIKLTQKKAKGDLSIRSIQDYRSK